MMKKNMMIQKMSTMRSRKVASNKFSSEEIEDIQQQIQRRLNMKR